ncbi:hypothetical protein [Streptomyces sp. H27-D2]|uniref:hypothetical protein n=1 Tax=Streptomyces sp. H27-D2 TaxID=3046304 RepID=UPI002DBE6D7F|nr:hypothetical protein [Streptomyces sp. H27-D2]MEC4018359.1 hypothetical protein [Streptomyces sp. H27-D2]
MTTVLFVHGTGVREPGYTAALAALRSGLGALRPDVAVEGCNWGDALGSHLRAEGVSIPGFQPKSAPVPPREEDEERARWALLYADPYAELALYAMTAAPETGFAPGVLPPGEALRSRAAGLAGSGAVGRAWEAASAGAGPGTGVRAAVDTGVGAAAGGALGAAVEDLLASPSFQRATDAAAGAEPGGLPRLVGRAFAARLLGRLPGGPGVVPVGVRDALVDAVVDELGGDERGIADAVSASLGATARMLERAGGSRWLVSRRGAMMERSVGFAGDIMSYLVRGEAVRAYVADRARELPSPVVLLGHSLGGIVSFDLLASGVLGSRTPGASRTPGDAPPGPGAAAPGVELLITVGSQAPLLYELDALPSRPYGTGLPAGFPAWVNIYDPRDLLSFLGAGVFGDGVHDIGVDNGQPASAAHSAYWANPEVHRILAGVLPK